MKGVYLEKHGGARSHKMKAENKKFIAQNDTKVREEKKDENSEPSPTNLDLNSNSKRNQELKNEKARGEEFVLDKPPLNKLEEKEVSIQNEILVENQNNQLLKEINEEEKSQKDKFLKMALGFFISGVLLLALCYLIVFLASNIMFLGPILGLIGLGGVITGIVFFVKFDRLKKKENNLKPKASRERLGEIGAIIAYIAIALVVITSILILLFNFYFVVSSFILWMVTIFQMMAICLGVISIVLGALGGKNKTKFHLISLYLGIAILVIPTLIYIAYLVAIFIF
ncbi:MAG: hypothetical protein R2799_00340 [Crocinitomicaceae bacterium]